MGRSKIERGKEKSGRLSFWMMGRFESCKLLMILKT